MRRKTIFWTLLLSFVVGPSAVSAAGIESADFEIGDDELALQLAATGELGDPLVRTEPGYIRVWFPGVDENVRLNPEPDGIAIRSIRIRPGFGDTSVVLFRVRPGVTVPVSAVRVERSGDRGTIYIQRDAIPMPEEGPPPAGVPAAAVDELADQEEALMAEPPPAEVVVPEEVPAERSEEPATATSAQPETAPAPPSLLTADATPGMGVLLIISLLLGAAYCVVKLVARGGGRRSLEDIQIVSSKRLGNRHQIVLVRALGEDHLLSINGTQTHCISSTPTVADDELDDGHRSEDPPSGVIARIQDRFYFKPKLDDGVTKQPSRPSAFSPASASTSSSERDRFGAKLLRYAIANENSQPKNSVRAQLRPRESEAVAGLVKLRERLAQSA